MPSQTKKAKSRSPRRSRKSSRSPKRLSKNIDSDDSYAQGKSKRSRSSGRRSSAFAAESGPQGDMKKISPRKKSGSPKRKSGSKSPNRKSGSKTPRRSRKPSKSPRRKSGSPRRTSKSPRNSKSPRVSQRSRGRSQSSLNPNASSFIPSFGQRLSVGSTGTGRARGSSVKKPKRKISFDGVAPPIDYDVNAGWTIYWNPPMTLKHSTHNDQYVKGLKELQTFDGINDFWSKAAELQKPSRVHHGSHNFMMFRKGLVPAWESFPCGGSWIVNYPRGSTSSQKIDSVWETIMFNLVAEGFGTPEVVGASLHIRDRGYRLCIWNRDNRLKEVRFNIADKLRMLLSIHTTQEIHYKFFAKCLQDGSTTSRATPYQFVKVKL